MSIFTFSNSRSLLQKTTFLVVRLFIVVALILPQISSAQFNAQINYQGKLLGSGNSAAANGNYNVRFKIYNVATGGSPLWTETWCYSTDSGATCTGSGTDSRVALTSGLFSVMLGSTTPFSGIDFNQTLYLGVDIGGSGATPTWDGEMLPRKKMGAVPAAFVAQTLDGLRKEQFLRTDATNATNTASTFVTLSQAGAGDIARFIGASGANVLTVKSGGGVGIGSTTPQNMLGIERTTGNTLVDIKTNDSSTAAINFINNLNTWQAGISTYGVNAGGFNIGDRSTGSSVVRFAIAPTTGNVGIGTSTPSSKLTVAGDGWFGGNLDVSSSTSVIRISDTGNDALTLNTQLGQLQFYTGGASSNRVVSSIVSLSDYNGSHSVSRGALQFNISSTGAVSEAMRISSAGNVGIGTANPGYALDVSGVINATSLYRIGSQKVIELSGSTLTFGSGNAGSITALTSNAGITMTLVGGNTGIGTTSPWGRLAITGSSTDATNAFLVANSNNTPLFSILNNGNVGIGTTSPFALLSVAGNAYIGGNLTATGTVTLGTLTGPLQAINGLVSATSTMSIAYGGTGLSTAPTYGQVLLGQANGTYTLVSTSSLGITGSGSSFSYLFPGNATSTLLSFTGGLISGASTTIGSGTQAGGLTISGGATTTGNAYFAGNVGIGTTSPESLLDVDGIGTFGTENASTAQLVVKGGASGAAMVTLKRTAGAPSQFSWLLAGGGLTFADDTNGFNVTNIFGDNSQNQLFIGQRGKIVSDSRVSLLSGTTFSPSAGSDVAASELRIQGGLGTGAGTPGDVSFYTGTTLGSGSTAQSGSSRMVIKGNTGFVGIGTTSPVSFLAVQGVGSTGQYGALLNLVTTNTTGAALALSGNGTYDGRTWRILSGGSSNLSGLATGKLVFEDTTAGQTRMVIDTSGNVGIGTTSPTAKLTVWGTSGGTIFNAINSVGSTVFSIDNGTGNVSFQSQGGETQIGGGSGARFNVSSLTSSKIATQISGVAGQTADILNVNSVNGASGDFLTVEANGNVGIGTTSPASKLHIEGAGGATITIQRNDSAQGNGTLAFTGNDGVIDGSIAYNNVIAGALTFNTGGATSANTRMTINSSGNVGIGTSTPTGLLNLASTLPYLYLTDTNAATNNKHWFIENNSGTFGLGTTTDALGLTSTRALTITNAGTMTVAGPVYTSGGGAGGVGTNILATANYVQSRGMNLVSNGSGLLNNNYNFSAWTFDPVETHGGMGSFLQSGSVTRFSDEAIPVDVSKTYREVIWAKSGDTGGANYNAANKQYMGIILLDADGNNVQLPHSVKYPGSTDTTLAAPLNPGDTTVTLTDGTGWYNGSTYYNRNFSWWPYTNAKGYTYPNYTYTRNLSSNYSGNGTNPNGTWSEGGISGNTITLRVAWAGPALAAGTPVRNFQDGSTYKYIAASNISVPNTWTKYEGYIGPASGSGLEVNNEFRAGTAFVKLLFLVNYGGTPENYLRVSDIAFTEMSANNLELATASQQGVVSTTTQTFGGNKTFTGLTTLGYASTTQIGSTGNAYFATAGGNVGIGTTSPFARLAVTNTTASIPGFVVRGASAQSANIQEWQTNDGVVRARITENGDFSNAPTSGSEIFGRGAVVGTGINQLVIGNGASTAGSSAPGSIAIGNGATISADSGGGGSIVIGTGSTFAGSNATIIGNGVNGGNGNGVIVIGQGSTLSGGAAMALGLANTLSNFQARAIGNSNVSTQISTTLIGTDLLALRRNEIVLGDSTLQSGTGGWTGGQRLRIAAAVSDNTATSSALFDTTWLSSTAGSQRSRLTLSAYNVATAQEGLRIDAGSTLPTVVLASGGGNVGIGTTSPWAQLSVNPSGLSGPAFAVGSSTETKFQITNSGDTIIGGNNQIAFGGLTVSDVAIKKATIAAGPGLYVQYADGSNPGRLQTGGLWVGGIGSSYLRLFDIAQGLQLGSGIGMTWTSGVSPDSTGSDTGLYRLSAGKLGLGNSTAGDVSGTFVAANIGVSTTSPFTRLAVGGNAYIGGNLTATGTLTVGATNATSTFGHGIDIASGCFAIAGTCISGGAGSGTVNSGTQGQIAFYNTAGTAVSGTSTLVVAQNQTVGIGTTSPREKLEVAGNLLLGSNSSIKWEYSSTTLIGLEKNSAGIRLGDPVSYTAAGHTYPTFDFRNWSVSGFNDIDVSDPGAGEGLGWTGTSGGWIIDVSPLDRSNADGNLNLYNASSNNIALWRPSMWVYNSSNYTTATAQSNGGLNFTTTGTGNITFNQGGNVGIGTTTPYERLAVVGTVVADRFVATSTTATSTFAGGIRVTAGGAQISNLTSCDSLDTDASGNLICGTDAGAGASPWSESAGVIAPSSANSRVVIGTLSGVTNTALSVFATSSGTTGLVVRGAANQTANFATFQDSTGKAVASINNRGGLSIDVSSTDIVKNTNSTGLSTDFDFTGSTLTNITTTAGQNFIDVTEGTIPASGQGQWVATTTVTAAALGAGGFVILREDGGYLVVHGGGSATASVWDGVTGGTMSALSQNVVSTGSVGAGAIALRRPDGRYLLIHGGGANATTIFDPYARTPAVAGPTLGGLCTTGTNAFLRADGLYVIMCGGTTSWGTYNPSTNTYTAGTAVGTAFGAGAHAIIRDNNTFLVFAGGNTNTHYGYNPFAAAAGTMTAGVITANAPVINTGAFSIRRNEGKFLVIGGAINASTIYDPTETSSNSGWGTMTTQTVSAGFGPTQALADGAQAVWRQDGKYLLLLGGSTATNIIDPSKSDSLQFTTGPALASAAGTGATMFMVPDGTYALVRGGGTAVDIYNAGFVVGGQQYGTRLASYESECITSTSLNPYSSLTWTASGEGRVVVQVRVGIGSCTGNYTQLQSNGDKIPYLDGANRVQFRIFLQRALPKFNDQEWGIRRQNITRYRRNKSDPTIYDLVLRNDNMFKRSLYEFGANVNATSSASSSVPVIVNLSNRVDGVGLGYSSVSNPEYNTLANTTNLAAFNPTFASSTQLTVPVATSSIVMKRPDGRFIILSGATTTTNVAQLYNPVDRSITTNGSQPSAAPGPGALAFKRPDGKFFIVIGNNNTTTIIYDPVGDTFSAGPALTANAGRGAFAIPLPNGQILIGLGAGGTATSVYDPIQNTMKSGPVSTVTLGGGTMALPRPDGTYIVFSGTTDACALSTATALFDPATMAFRTNAGVSVTTGLGPGAYAFQRTDGLWVIVHGGGTATTCTATNRTAIYNPVTNFLVAGPTFGTIPSLGSRVDGNFAIPTADGNWALIQAGATTTAARVWLYLEKYGAFTSNIQSQIGVMVSSYTVNAVNGPNATISGTGPGAIAFQQDDGRFFTLAGGHAPNLLPLTAASSTDRTYMIDAGWVSSGLYKSEAMFVPDLDANSVINWKSTSYKGLSVEVRTATSMDGLQTATARQIETSGGLINPGVGEKWVQFNFNFSRTFPSYRGIYTDVWYNGATPVHTQRTIDSPVLSEVTITKDTDFLNLKMDGLSVFRISSNGNVFLTDGATVNTSGADLAERYSSRQQLKPGEVVSIDPINNHAVQRTTHQYQNDVIGIVSTDPGFVAGAYTEDSYPIALVGRVPVKVSTENGMIKAGDRLTPSSVPGHAMKASLAGRVVGKALESLDASKLEACPSSDIIIPGRKCGTVMVFMNLIDYSGETIDDAILNWETVQKELLRQQDIQTVQVSVLDGGIEAEFESDPLSDITIGISTSSMMSTTTRSARVLSFLEDLKKERESVAASRSEVFVDRVSAVNEVIAPSFLAKALRAETVDGAQIISARIEAGDIETARLLVRGKNSDIVFGEDGQVFLMRKATSSNATTTAGVSTSTALLLTEALALPPGTLISFTDDGGAFFAGELVARGLKTESLTVEGLTTLSGGLLVSSIGTKEGELKVMADTFFAGRAYFNSDSAGDALIPRGGKEVAIKFVKPFAEKPVVNANFSFNESTTTPEQEDEIFRQDIRFVITRRSPEGFRITLNKPAPLDVLFSWTAVGVKDKTTFNGVGAQGLTIFEPQKMHPTTSLPIILTTPQEQLVLISTSTVPVSTTTPASESPSQDSTVSSTEQVQNAPTQIDQGGVILQADPTPAPAPVEVSTPESVATPAVESVPAE